MSNVSGVMCLCVYQVINGMGGVGKSSVAEKYAFLWHKLYADGVFHFNAETLATLHMSIRNNVRIQTESLFFPLGVTRGCVV